MSKIGSRSIFKFTIIMSVYNAEQWIDEAVESVLKQDIDFKKNVEIVFVNDGSTDDSGKYCLKYQKQFPHNIKYIKQDNQGLSAARNTGLKHRNGKYISFFDPDDIWEKNVLSEVWSFFEQHHSEIDSVAIPLRYFEAKEGLHPRYELLGKKNRIIDLEKEPAHAVLSAASSFYKTEIFKKFSFDTKMFGSEDVKFNSQVYTNTPRYGYVCESGVCYNYRIRKQANSIVSQLAYHPDSFRTVKYLLESITKGKKNIEPFKQEIIIYELRSRLATIRSEYFSDVKEYHEIVESYKRSLEWVDESRLNGGSPFIQSNAQKYIFASLILQKNPVGITKGGFIYFDHSSGPTSLIPQIFLKNVELEDKMIVLDVLYHDYNLSQFGIELLDDDQLEVRPLKIRKASTSFDVRYGEFHISQTTHLRYKIPYEHTGRYHFYIVDRKGGIKVPVERLVQHRFLRFALNSRHLKIWSKNQRIRIFENQIEIKKAPNWQWLNKLVVLVLIAKRNKKIAWARLMAFENKKYILIYDRPHQAKDNGEALFEYINREQHDIAKITYYVINKDSDDYGRLTRIGNVVSRGSLKHKFLYLNSRLILSSHLHHLFIDPFPSDEMYMYRDLLKRKFVWLQHGVNMNSVEPAANKFNENVDSLVVSSSHEVREFSEPKYFYDQSMILQTGLPRFDKLYDDQKKLITIMPTWRSYLTGKITNNGTHEMMDGFIASDYFQSYSRLLTSPDLLAVLSDNRYKLQFILHPGLSIYESLFKDLESKNVKVLVNDEVDYVKTFAESAILVTDYSSVYFDFAYLQKPTIFYQFDSSVFFGKHYRTSDNFSYALDAPGPIYDKHDDVIKAIHSSIKNGCIIEQKFNKRIERLFLYRDRNNSKRVIAALKDRGLI